MKKNSIKNLFASLAGTIYNVSLDQTRITGITLEIYTGYKKNYKSLAYFECDSIKECVKKAFEWINREKEKKK